MGMCQRRRIVPPCRGREGLLHRGDSRARGPFGFFPLLIVRCNLLLKGAARHIPEQGQLVQINGLIHLSAPSSFGRTRSMKKLCRQHKTPSERYH